MFLTFNCPSLGIVERQLLKNNEYLIDADTKADIGAVVAARTVRDGTPLYLLVKKAYVPRYIYSGMWVLPGGMVRTQGSDLSHLLLPLKGQRTHFFRNKCCDSTGITAHRGRSASTNRILR